MRTRIYAHQARWLGGRRSAGRRPLAVRRRDVLAVVSARRHRALAAMESGGKAILRSGRGEGKKRGEEMRRGVKPALVKRTRLVVLGY